MFLEIRLWIFLKLQFKLIFQPIKIRKVQEKNRNSNKTNVPNKSVKLIFSQINKFQSIVCLAVIGVASAGILAPYAHETYAHDYHGDTYVSISSI